VSGTLLVTFQIPGMGPIDYRIRGPQILRGERPKMLLSFYLWMDHKVPPS